jgi:AbrB family looped-hinge helix DNA binding protein
MPREGRLSSKGQVVIPREIRAKLGLRRGDRVRFELLEGKRVVIQPAVDPPPDVFVRAGGDVVEGVLRESSDEDELKVARLLRALGAG